ncbi:MAG TPA: sigma-70 family RNA polymerase sigma factor [Pyrinomonadaceae bacterium]|nr:sigma-70 family RNA polymerase sigma factor [Pyrinomonadaceae bacterium]
MSSYPGALQNENAITRVDDDSANRAVKVERTDRQLVDLVLAGDEFAFEQIFDRHKRMVAAIAARYFRRPEQIEEIIQLSFSKTFIELGRFRGLHELSLASWIARITTNACFDTLRSEKRKPEDLCCDLTEGEIESLTGVVGHTTDAENLLLNRDLAEKLLSRVAADDRALLQMLYVEEMSVAEIADATGWSQSKVKIRAWRSRNTLRRVLRKFL